MKPINTYIIEKFRVSADMNTNKIIDIEKNINDVWKEFENMIYRNNGLNNFYILEGLIVMLSNFSSKNLSEDEESLMETQIEKSFNNEILKLADTCKEFTWWEQDDEDLDDEFYKKITSIEDCDTICDLYDELIVNVPNDKGIIKIVFKGYLIKKWVVFILNDHKDKYMRAFVICKL